MKGIKRMSTTLLARKRDRFLRKIYLYVYAHAQASINTVYNHKYTSKTLFFF